MIEAGDAFVTQATVFCSGAAQYNATPLTHKSTLFWGSFSTKIFTVPQSGCDHRAEQDNKDNH